MQSWLDVLAWLALIMALLALMQGQRRLWEVIGKLSKGTLDSFARYAEVLQRMNEQDELAGEIMRDIGCEISRLKKRIAQLEKQNQKETK